MAKKKQDQTFEETLKAQQQEMLDSEDESDFQCTKHSDDIDEEMAYSLVDTEPESANINETQQKQVTVDSAYEDFRCPNYSETEEPPNKQNNLKDNDDDDDEEDEDEFKSIYSTDEEEETDSEEEVVQIEQNQKTESGSNKENDEEETDSDQYSVEIIMNNSCEEEESTKRNEEANIPKKVEDDNKEIEATTKKLNAKPKESSATNSNLVSSSDFKGIHNFDQLLIEGLPKALLEKIYIKYTKEELLKICQNRNEQQWNEYIWKNHGENWKLGNEPFEMDAELRCPYYKKLEILRKRQEEAKRWHNIGKPSNSPASSKHADFPPGSQYPSKKTNNKDPGSQYPSKKTNNKDSGSQYPSKEKNNNDFPFTSAPQIQANWILSQPLFQLYIDGVNKVIEELSGATI